MRPDYKDPSYQNKLLELARARNPDIPEELLASTCSSIEAGWEGLKKKYSLSEDLSWTFKTDKLRDKGF